MAEAGTGRRWPCSAAAHSLDEVLADPDRALDLLDRLGDPARTVPAGDAAHASTRGSRSSSRTPPTRRTGSGSARTTVPREAAVVLDLPYLLPLLGDERTPVPADEAPGPVADLLDLPLAGELLGPLAPDAGPAPTVAWAEVPGAELAAARLRRPRPGRDGRRARAAHRRRHPGALVAGRRDRPHRRQPVRAGPRAGLAARRLVGRGRRRSRRWPTRTTRCLAAEDALA